jgi:sigma-B regulation protein RsbU (phosphoserine phosphatase)
MLGESINFCKITIYTDGITEALNNNLEMLDMEGWKKIVERVKALSGTSLPVEGLLAEVKAFIGDAEQADDITLLVITSHL